MMSQAWIFSWFVDWKEFHENTSSNTSALARSWHSWASGAQHKKNIQWAATSSLPEKRDAKHGNERAAHARARPARRRLEPSNHHHAPCALNQQNTS